MLPAANPGGNAANREVPLPTMSSIKPGNVAVSGTAQIKSADELRYLPIASMPTKPCNATTINTFNSSNNINNNNSIKHINNNATLTTAMKTKLTQINLVQNQLKPNVNANNTAQPRYKLVPSNASSNGNANSSLISILSPKTLINPHNNNTQSQSLLIRSMATVPVPQQQKQQQQQPQQQQQNGIVYKSNNNISSSTKTSPCTTTGAQPNVITLVSKKSATNDPATTIRAPVILSKAAVEKLRLKFGQVQAQANAGALILSKPLKSNNNNNSNSAISRPAPNIVASNAAVPKITIPAAAATPTTTTTTPIPMTLSTLPPLSTLPTPIPLAMTPSMTTPTPLSTPTLTMHTPVTASTPMTVPMDIRSDVPTAVPLAVPTALPMAVPLVVPLTKPIPLPMAMPMPSTNISTPMPMLMPRPMFVPASTEQSMTVSSNNALVNSMATNVPIPTPLTMPFLLPNLKIDHPEIKISPLPAATQNGASPTQKPPPSLAVIMPTLRKIATTATAVAKADQEATPKLQRSNSLGESAENPKIISVQNNANERRHSVAIMAKELDVIVEQPMPIETITIDDDDSDEEREREAAQKQKEQEKEQEPAIKQPMEQQKQASRKNSTASRNSIQSGNSRGSNSNRSSTSSRSSDVELIMEQESQQHKVQKEAMVEEPKQQPEVKPQEEPKQQEELKQQNEVKPQEELKPQEESKQQEPLKPQEELKPQPTCNTSTLSIVRAESLPLSKEDFEKSLRCDEALSSPSSMSACSSSTQSSEGPECTAVRSYKRSMEQNFGMLHWWDQHQSGSLQNSNTRFELNRFNLLQINERCEPRRGPASYFDIALFDRTNRRTSNSSHPLLYLCSRCNCHGPASDFLAPRFCSLACVRRAHKRRQAATATNARLSKQRRLQESLNQLRENHQKEKEKERKPQKPQKRVFRWSEYLNTKGMGGAAPIHLFMNPFPTGPNCFERGMKLEAIDPENCSLFCVCTIVEVRGYRLKLNFDGYSNMYDFWVNADSIDIFPPGWCERTSRVLQAPKGYCPERFTWYRYLVKTNAKAAPCALFTHLNGPKFALNNSFGVGMHLEAEDLNDTGKICVATIADVLDERVRVHFDGWDDCYDFWVHVNSPYIHPCGWHEGRQQLIVPPDYQNVNFNWSDYIAEAGGTAAPAELFAPRQPLEFQPRMKLEVVDQRNPCLIRPATVVNRKSYRVQLHLDCWPTEYYFWLEDDSPDLHPIGWCEATAHELEVPPGFQQPASTVQCDVMEGCRGYGNAKRFDFNVHAQRDCCPYAPENWRQWRLKTVKPPRVAPEEIRQAEPPKPELTEESLEALERRLNNIETSSSSLSLLKPKSQRKRQSVKSRSSSDSEPPEPKVLKHEEDKPLPLPSPLPSPLPLPLPVEHKPEPMELLPPAAAECDVDPRCLKIAKSIVEEYGPQIKRNYHLWQTNGGFDMDNLKSNPIYWTTWDVYEFVERALKSTTIAKILFDEEIDGRALLMLGRKDLANYFQLKVGPTVTLFSLIVNLRIAVVTKFETPRLGLFGDSESFDSPTVNGHHEGAESTTGESMSSSSSGSEQMEEEESQEEEEEEEVEEKVEGEEVSTAKRMHQKKEEEDEEAEEDDEAEVDEEDEEAEEDEQAEVDEEEEEDEEAEEDEEEEDEEEEVEDDTEEQTVVNEVNDDESDKQEQAESSEEEDELEEDEDGEENEEANEDEEKVDEDEEENEDEEADEDEEEDENEEEEVETDNVENEDQEENEECAVETGEKSKEEQEQEMDADDELQEQETSSELEEPKKEDCADEFLMGEEDEEEASDTEDDEEESNEHDAKNNADENDSDYDAAEGSEDLSDDNLDAEADEYDDDDDDDYDDKVLEQDLNQSALTQYPKHEPSDEEDVVLDSDDFLSVKPSIVNPEDMDTDVVPTSPHHDLLPVVDDSVEDIS